MVFGFSTDSGKSLETRPTVYYKVVKMPSPENTTSFRLEQRVRRNLTLARGPEFLPFGEGEISRSARNDTVFYLFHKAQFDDFVLQSTAYSLQ